jgi:hypothetical protein
MFGQKLVLKFYRNKKNSENFGYFCKFKKMPKVNKQSPKRRKFAQSGHPECVQQHDAVVIHFYGMDAFSNDSQSGDYFFQKFATFALLTT